MHPRTPFLATTHQGYARRDASCPSDSLIEGGTEECDGSMQIHASRLVRKLSWDRRCDRDRRRGRRDEAAGSQAGGGRDGRPTVAAALTGNPIVGSATGPGRDPEAIYRRLFARRGSFLNFEPRMRPRSSASHQRFSTWSVGVPENAALSCRSARWRMRSGPDTWRSLTDPRAFSCRSRFRSAASWLWAQRIRTA
jgi:hypothetical protein